MQVLFLTFLCVQLSFATVTTYVVASQGTSAWGFTSPSASNPNLEAHVGDTLNFQITGTNGIHIFDVHLNDGHYAGSTTNSLSVDGTFSLLVGADAAGHNLQYLCLIHTNMAGSIHVACVAPSDANCNTSTCGTGVCNTCNNGYFLTGSTCTPCVALPANCSTGNCQTGVCSGCSDGYHLVSTQCVPGCVSSPEHCSASTCGGTCTACADGYFVNNVGNCSACTAKPANCNTATCDGGVCTACATGFHISSGNCVACATPGAHCSTSNCESGLCTACETGYVLATAACITGNCQTFSCGYTNAGEITCSEHSATSYSCTCPDGSPVNVDVTSSFGGCGDATTTSSTDALSHLDNGKLEHYVTESIPQVSSVTVNSVSDNTISLSITASSAIDITIPQLQEAIAKFLGAGWTASDISIQVVSKKRQTTSNLLVTVSDPSASTASVVTSAVSFLIALMVALF